MSCALVGSYAAIVPVDHYIGSNLKYIFINTMRRATVPGFNEAIIDPPFQAKGSYLEHIRGLLFCIKFRIAFWLEILENISFFHFQPY